MIQPDQIQQTDDPAAPVKPAPGITKPQAANTNPIAPPPALAPASGQAAPAMTPPTTFTPPVTPLPADQTQPVAAATPSAPSTPSIAPAVAPAVANTPSGVGVAGIDPNNDLRNSSVLPTDAVDRNKLTSDRLSNYMSEILPNLRANIRKETQGASAMGRQGSGMLRTDVGNLDLAAERDLNQKFSDLTSNATEGSINDAANNRNEYRAERGYQNGLEDQAYNRGIQGVTLEDALTNSALGRGLSQLGAGNQNNPAQMQLILSQLFGDQSTAAGKALSGLIQGRTANGGLTTPTQGGGIADASTAGGLPQWLQDLLKGGSGASGGDLYPDEYGVAP